MSMIGVTRRQLLAAGALAPMLASLPQSARTQPSYPERPIRIVYPYAAGGVGDTILRMIAPRMEQRLGQRLVIEPKPGAAGNIGTQEIARAEPDGYSILVAATNNFVINQFLTKLSFDPMVALEPVGKVAEIPIVLFSNPAVPPAISPRGPRHDGDGAIRKRRPDLCGVGRILVCMDVYPGVSPSLLAGGRSAIEPTCAWQRLIGGR
jgi:hypothetical protein